MLLRHGLWSDDHKIGLFGLGYGQVRGQHQAVYRNGTWYNGIGEGLGCGDLSYDDFKAIHEGLPAGEAFVVLSSHDGYQQDTPDITYIASRASYIITGKDIWLAEGPQMIVLSNGLQVKGMAQQDVEPFLRALLP